MEGSLAQKGQSNVWTTGLADSKGLSTAPRCPWLNLAGPSAIPEGYITPRSCLPAITAYTHWSPALPLPPHHVTCHTHTFTRIPLVDQPGPQAQLPHHEDTHGSKAPTAATTSTLTKGFFQTGVVLVPGKQWNI